MPSGGSYLLSNLALWNYFSVKSISRNFSWNWFQSNAPPYYWSWHDTPQVVQVRLNFVAYDVPKGDTHIKYHQNHFWHKVQPLLRSKQLDLWNINSTVVYSQRFGTFLKSLRWKIAQKYWGSNILEKKCVKLQLNLNIFNVKYHYIEIVGSGWVQIVLTC